MTVNLNLPPQVENAYLAEARAKGQSIEGMQGAALIAGAGGYLIFIFLFCQHGRDRACQTDGQKNNGELGAAHKQEDSRARKDDSPFIMNPSGGKSCCLQVYGRVFQKRLTRCLRPSSGPEKLSRRAR